MRAKLAALRARRGRWAIAAALLGAAAPACIDAGSFTCERDSQCEWRGQPGFCLDPGYCAVVDLECDSGYRFHGRASGEVAGECANVPLPGTTTSSSTTVATTAATTTGDPSTGSTGDVLTSGDGSTGVACEGTECACAVSVATGVEYTCVARTDGAVVCWGDNEQGQLGEGETSNPTPYLRYPSFGSETEVIEIWAGNDHTCGRTVDSSLLCWGDNGSGEALPLIEADMVVGPVDLDFVGSVTVVAMAPAHTCAAGDAATTTDCWGANAWGELGSLDPPPGPYEGPELGTNPIEALAAGRDHTCALIDGTVRCWGRNQLGQLGNPAEVGPTIVPQTVLLDRPPLSIAAGRDHTCAIVTDGTLRCWGSNAVGQVGDGTMANATTPVTPAGPPEKVLALSARLDTTCALTELGHIFCWGDINGTALGTEVPDGDPLLTPTRVLVTDELPEPIVEFDAGRFHICARAESGRLWCWGTETKKQLGPIEPPDGRRAVEMNLECPS